MRLFSTLLGTLLLSLALAPAAQAQKRVALVVGNAAYANTAPLANPGNDATDVAAALRRLGFTVLDGRNLDKRNMERTIRQFGVELAGADVALFFYAGHGLQIGGQNYLVPTDAKLSEEGDVDFEGVPLSLVLKQMEREAKVSIVLLDACRDNPLARNLARSMGTRAASIGQGLAEVRTGVGTLIGFATQPGAFALDGTGRNSPYTTALLDHIEMPGKELSAILVAVRNDVLKSTGGKQVPWEHTSLTGQVFLRDPVAVSTTGGPVKNYEKELEIALWNSVKDTQSAAAFQAYLERYPNSTFSALARLRIAELTTKKDASPVQAAPQQQPGHDPAMLARALRSELYRVGCVSDATGRWDEETKRGLSFFARLTKVSIATDQPSAEALDAVMAKKGRVCPLKCGAGQVEDDGQCVAKVREKPEKSSRTQQRSDQGAGKSSGKLCWTDNGRGSYAVTPCR